MNIDKTELLQRIEGMNAELAGTAAACMDDVSELIAAAQCLREFQTVEAQFYSKAIAEIARRMLAAPVPPMSAVPSDVRAAVDRMCVPLDASRLSGATAELDAKNMAAIKVFIDSLEAAPVAQPAAPVQFICDEDECSNVGKVISPLVCDCHGTGRCHSVASADMTDAQIVTFFEGLLTSKLYVSTDGGYHSQQVVDSGNEWVTDDIILFARALLARSQQ